MTGSRSIARILPERKFADGTPPLHYDSTTTPIPLQYYFNTTSILLHYDSTTTPLLLQYYFNTTPQLLQYYSNTTPLLLHSLSSSFSHSSTSPFLSLPWCGIFFLGEKKREECRYIYKKCYFCILIAHTAERGNF